MKRLTDRRFNPAHLHKLDDPKRLQELPPLDILAMLEIRSGDVVLDIGAGTGYFTLPAASLSSATVYALDVQPEMLQVLNKRAAEKGLTHIKLVEGEIEQMPLPDQVADRVIASLVLHEVEPLSRGLEEIKRVLKPRGRLLCLEWEKKETEQGPPLSHRIGSDEMKRALQDAGFSIVRLTFPTEAHYIILAEKGASSS